MVLAALLLICSIPQMDDVMNLGVEPATSAPGSKPSDAVVYLALPAMPAPKLNTDAGSITPNPPAPPFLPVKPVYTGPRETPRERKIWYALLVAGHGGAAFDAWSTRRAVTGGYGQESNPLLRPFAHSNAIYAATQVSPAFMDFLGKRMMASQHRWVHRMWWLPQAAGASFSFAAGAHNIGVVH